MELTKTTKKTINEIIRTTPKELKGQALNNYNKIDVMYNIPSQANWAYIVSAIKDDNGLIVLVVSRFGYIL